MSSAPACFSAAAPLTSRPSQGVCDVVLVFHIDSGNYGGVSLDGLNVAVVAHAPGPMAEGNWSAAAYIDERADDQQTAALGAIFTGAEGGPMAVFAPLIATQLGVKKAPIRYRIEGKNRSVEIPGIMQMAVEPLRHCIRAARSGRTAAIRPRRTGSRWRSAARAAPLPITACAGTIPGRTAITRRSTGRTSASRDRRAAAPFVVAIDGPAASGKGTLARRLAERFGLAHLDTGKLYRATALLVLAAGGDPADPHGGIRGAAGRPGFPRRSRPA